MVVSPLKKIVNHHRSANNATTSFIRLSIELKSRVTFGVNR